MLNENFAHFKHINQRGLYLREEFFTRKKSLNEIEGNNIIQSKSKSFCFMLYLISLNEKSYWDGVTKNNKSFCKKKLWS